MKADYYVSPSGRDTWSGTLPAANDAGTDGPFATIGRARDAVRDRRARRDPGAARAPVTVALRGGTYRLGGPLRFGPDDSGDEGSPVVYRSYPGERAVWSGGRRITGWEKGRDGVWTVRVPEVADGSWYFRSLWVNGARRLRPRLPKSGAWTVAGRAEPRHEAFRFEPGQIDPAWHDRDHVEVVVVQFWTEARLRIASIDTTSSTVAFTGASWRPLDWSKAWYVENVREALSLPGEWYLDRTSGLLSYVPHEGEDPNRDEVIAPVAETLVEIDGGADGSRSVEHLELVDLDFAHTGWHMPHPHGIAIPQAEIPVASGVVFAGNLSYGENQPQVAAPVPPTLLLRGARACAVERCEIAHTGGWGVEVGDRCRDIRIAANHVHDIGAGAVRIGSAVNPERDEDEATGVRVEDNRIHDGSNVFLGPAAIWIGQSGRNRVAHNEIRGAFEWGISVGWNWNYWPPNRHRENVIERNHIHHVGESHTGCHGAIYFLGVSPGTICRGNLIHDITGGGCGIILDNACFGIVVERNVIHHTDAAGICFNYNDSGNVVQNNIFALSRGFAYERYGDPPATGGEKVDQTGIFYRNIFTWREGTFMLKKEWVNFDTLMNYNLYWDASGKPIDFAGLDFAGWQAKGLDRASLVADPLFKDPEHGDFYLPPSSPAFRLGFRPVEVAGAGPRPGR
jgi:parallel beta-helix repeat protein